MKYEKLFMGAYNLHLIKTDKFKTNTIEINFRSKINNNLTLRNLLKMVMLDSTKDYNTERQLVKATENLYDLKLISSTNRIGTNSNIAFKMRFLDESYTEEGMNEESILFLINLIFNPNVNNNSFDEEIVNKNKEKLKKAIISIKDNKLKYALLKLFEKTKDMPYSKNSYGSLEELEQIDGIKLYEYYKHVLKNDIIDIFVVGNFDTEKLKELFKENFKVDTFKKTYYNILVDELPKNKKINTYKEYDDVNQTQLTILCSLHDLTDYERMYVIRIYNEILGGSSNSMLFENVREKNSLCYYINSDVKAYDNILFIYSGINNNNVDKAIKLIRRTIKEIANGNIKEEVLTSAKETITSGILASMDNPSGIINTYYAHELVGSELFEERISNFNKVTKEDIVNVSKKININSILTLQKGENNEND